MRQDTHLCGLLDILRVDFRVECGRAAIVPQQHEQLSELHGVRVENKDCAVQIRQPSDVVAFCASSGGREEILVEELVVRLGQGMGFELCAGPWGVGGIQLRAGQGPRGQRQRQRVGTWRRQFNVEGSLSFAWVADQAEAADAQDYVYFKETDAYQFNVLKPLDALHL
ncbi:hypothetical protein C8Q74DRAFT_1213805 [Fomes fomentarius]|nr:hypothetical protein C8Q74DRAFT_1213805 [Fomes fomentarius]